MTDSLQESLKIASRRKQQWMERMKEAGYIIVGENAFQRTKDKTSPSGYRDLLVTSYGKDFRNKFQGMNLPTSAGYKNKSGDFEQAKAENPGVQPRTWNETPSYDSNRDKAILDHIKKINNNQTVPEGTEPNKTIDSTQTNVNTGSQEAVLEENNVKETPNREQLKSDVFTINPETGEAVGVLTKAQRKAFDKKHQSYLQKNRNKLRTYTIKGETKPVKRYG